MGESVGVHLLLASGSTYRRDVLVDAGVQVTQVAPEIDERVLDDWLVTHGAEALAAELAVRKLDAVLPTLTAAERALPVVAADQVGVLDTATGPVLLTKCATADSATAQLRRLSGTTHRLVNGVIVAMGERRAAGIDVQEVTFRHLSAEEIERYVAWAKPFDTSGSYRIEDDGTAGAEPFVVRVAGEDRTGVTGMPLPLLWRLLAQLGVGPPG
ncbi:MAG: Maf family protein [Acidobacteria bacterium]|nr:Maf family protein [Acidobacteriota bacterium]